LSSMGFEGTGRDENNSIDAILARLNSGESKAREPLIDTEIDGLVCKVFATEDSGAFNVYIEGKSYLVRQSEDGEIIIADSSQSNQNATETGKERKVIHKIFKDMPTPPLH